MDFLLYFQKVMLLWQGSIVEIHYGIFRVFGPYFIEKLLGTFKILVIYPYPLQRRLQLIVGTNGQ